MNKDQLMDKLETVSAILGPEGTFHEMLKQLSADEQQKSLSYIARMYDTPVEYLEQLFTYETLVTELAKQMSSQELKDNLDYICNMYDLVF